MTLNNLNLSRGECEALEKYQSLLIKWNKTINLISKNSEKYVWKRHVMDSLQLLKYVDFSNSLIDIGSGAGLPGIVLSIGGIKDVTLVESDIRKAVFLRQAAKLSGNKINIIETRMDNNFIGNYDILTCRGVSNLSNILELTSGLKTGKMLLLKGESFNEEIANAQKHWLFNINLHDSITGNGKLLEISDIKKLL
jgi:16S rRNA (guanine527-N7)-methyltransferase